MKRFRDFLPLMRNTQPGEYLRGKPFCSDITLEVRGNSAEVGFTVLQ